MNELFPVLAFLAAAVVAVLVATCVRVRVVRANLRELARRHGGRFVVGSAWNPLSPASAEFTHRGAVVTVSDATGQSGRSGEPARVIGFRLTLDRGVKAGFALRPRGWWSRAVNWNDWTRGPLGDRDFEWTFEIDPVGDAATDVSRLLSLLGPFVRQSLLRLCDLSDRRGLWADFDGRTLDLRVPGSAYHANDLWALTTAVLTLHTRLAAAATLLDDGGGIEIVEVRETLADAASTASVGPADPTGPTGGAARPEPTAPVPSADPLAVAHCPVCGETPGGTAAAAAAPGAAGRDAPSSKWVLCRRCRTPHHRDCWDYAGSCAVYGCKESRFVRPA